MNKKDLKKLALMGIAGGALFASQAEVKASETSFKGINLAHSCAGRGGCGGQPSQDRSSCGGQSFKDRSSCGGSGQFQPSQGGCQSRSSGYYYQGGFVAENEAVAPTQNYISEDELLKQLDPQTKSLYMSLSPEGKALALKLASQPSDASSGGPSSGASCHSPSGCKSSQGNSMNKNEAVKAAAQKIAEKRSALNTPSY